MRVSSPVLRGPGGEIPPGYLPAVLLRYSSIEPENKQGFAIESLILENGEFNLVIILRAGYQT